MPRVRRKSVQVTKNQHANERTCACRQKVETDKFNIQPQVGNKSQLGVLLVSDGGLYQPCLSSYDGIAPFASSVSKSLIVASNSHIMSSYSTLLACIMYFVAKFIKTSGNNFLKTVLVRFF